YIVKVQPYGLADACTGGVEKFKQCPVPQPSRRVRTRSFKYPRYFTNADGFRKPFARHRRVDIAGGIRRRGSFKGPKLMEPPHGHYGPGGRADAEGRSPIGAVGQGLGKRGDMMPCNVFGPFRALTSQEVRITGKVT